ncbi:hypothetical protein CYJ29_05185 [Aerococcus loyolae]|uniref:Uncharacterized protein n=1 Tax=Aerococcus urinae TaxID=1376 RepID=A0A2I1L6P7_9LACT|nr:MULTISPECIES: hypothetical protein [Aerococcus]MCY3067827.1 hypothetical protein [Aerococcus mictus]MCY3080640.1 hypothetical protein [Aerococcus mictus]MDK6727946.1 hypothetical protein [Aerococcus urinae]MDK7910227.1 hypothetical protein [Aerococcus urinae]MDK8610037.1 hypothetical protein [Aerococcus urinae]
MKWKNLLYLLLVATTLAGCSCSPSRETDKEPAGTEEKSSQTANVSQSSESNSQESSQASSAIASESAPKPAATKEVQDSQVTSDPLASYDPLAIEYARIWLQLGANPAAEAINVHIIPQGTLINPYLTHGASYPETVTQLAGNRLVDGVVTYSSNRDGTINLYNIPLRFDLPDFNAIPESTYINETVKMANTTKRIAVEPNAPDRVIQTIQKLQR